MAGVVYLHEDIRVEPYKRTELKSCAIESTESCLKNIIDLCVFTIPINLDILEPTGDLVVFVLCSSPLRDILDFSNRLDDYFFL